MTPARWTLARGKVTPPHFRNWPGYGHIIFPERVFDKSVPDILARKADCFLP
jgi:hypothetical protein